MFVHPRHPAAAALAAFALAATLHVSPVHAGPAGAWERISPPAQSGGAAAYDASRQRLYVFGGDGTSLVHAVGTAGPPTEWTNLRAAGTPPAARSGPSLSYDPAGDRLIVFGGRDDDGRCYNDLWELTLSGTPTWSPIVADGDVPDPRTGFAACFDPGRGILVVFGGVDSLGDLQPGHLFQVDLTQPAPGWSEWWPSGDAPSARSGATLSDCPARDGLVLFGGNDGVSDLADAYTLDYGSHAWSRIDASGDVPPPTSAHLAAYDVSDDLLFTWGGTSGDGDVRSLSPASGLWTIRPNTNWQPGPAGHTHPIGAWLGETNEFLALDGDDNLQLFRFWFYPPDGSFWENWDDPGVAGELRYGSTFVYDRADARAFLSCGNDEYDHPTTSTWSYSFDGPHGWFNTWFRNLADNDTPALQRHTAVWDEKRRRMLVFGGMTGDNARRNDVYAMQDTLDGYYYWTKLAPSGTPPSARCGTASIYDPVGDRMLVFGGSDVSGYPRGDLWQLTLAPAPAWVPLVVPGGPGGLEDHTAIYDERHHRVIVFGGIDSLGLGVRDDAWALSLPGLSWTHLSPTGTPPPPRCQHTAVYDSRRGRMLVLGGVVASGDMRDAWELDLCSNPPAWTKLEPEVGPQARPIGRYLHAAVYDSLGDRMLVFGGEVPPLGVFGNPWAIHDLWSLQFDFSSTAAGVAGEPGRLAFRLGTPVPNPSRGPVRLPLTLSRRARVRAGIFDLAGRRVTDLADTVGEPGTLELEWNGRDADGAVRAPGLYFCRVDVDGASATRKVLRVP